MGEAVEYWNAMQDIRKARRIAFGVHCPQCKIKRPKAHPTILLPQQRCKVDGYRDPRQYQTEEQEREAFIRMGVIADVEINQEKGHAE